MNPRLIPHITLKFTGSPSFGATAAVNDSALSLGLSFVLNPGVADTTLITAILRSKNLNAVDSGSSQPPMSTWLSDIRRARRYLSIWVCFCNMLGPNCVWRLWVQLHHCVNFSSFSDHSGRFVLCSKKPSHELTEPNGTDCSQFPAKWSR